MEYTLFHSMLVSRVVGIILVEGRTKHGMGYCGFRLNGYLRI